MVLKECMLVENDCYKKPTIITNDKPTGIVVHSTGCNNKMLRRYVNPVKSQSCYDEVIADIGKNKYNNSWNRAGVNKCVHAFIGLNVKGEVETYHTLPFNVCAWGVGNGSKGSYNYNPTARIQFEICEDNLRDETYFNNAMKEAQEFCAYLCKAYSLPISSISSHHESYLAGYASNHKDCDHWMKKFGKDMNWFRDEVEKIFDEPKTIYRVQVGAYVVKSNAEKMLSKLKAAGFNGYITKTTKE